MNWFRVRVTKDDKTVFSMLKLAETKQEAVNEVKNDLYNHMNIRDYEFSAVLECDGH